MAKRWYFVRCGRRFDIDGDMLIGGDECRFGFELASVGWVEPIGGLGRTLRASVSLFWIHARIGMCWNTQGMKGWWRRGKASKAEGKR